MFQPKRGNFDTNAEYYKAWYQANKQYKLDWCKKHRAENADREKNRTKQYYETHKKQHQMRTNLRNRGPGMLMWYYRYRKEIDAFYAEARRKTAETGILHVVDHVWPLKHPDCCGLHVPWNLQVITGTENDQKGNKLPTVAALQTSGAVVQPIPVEVPGPDSVAL
jgi:hypothetical protein